MEQNKKFVKVANKDIYINPRFIVKFEFDNLKGVGEAVLCIDGELEREMVYRKDIEHLIPE